MALDAAHRSSIYTKLVPLLGEDDANVLMSEFPSVEADELVTKQFLRAELGTLENKLTGQIADLDTKFTGLIGELETRLTMRIGAAFGACTAILATLNLLT